MHPEEHRRDLMSFFVRVGHARVRVRGSNVADAIRQARRQLALELPRMWDVIHALDESQFEVAPDVRP